MKNPETSLEAPKSHTRVKTATLKLVGNSVAHSHLVPPSGTVPHDWEETPSSQLLLGDKKKKKDSNMLPKAVTLGQGSCVRNWLLSCLSLSTNKTTYSRCLWATEYKKAGWLIAAAEDLPHNRQRPIELGSLSLRGEGRVEHVPQIRLFRAPTKEMATVSSVLEPWWDLAYSRCPEAAENKK